jgi:signal transduction histidine kinase
MPEQLNEAGEAKNTASGNPEKITCAERTDADVKKELAFALKKLEIVGSITRHDVLNQLTAIVGYTELLSMMVVDPQQLSFIEKEKLAFDKIRRQFRFAKDYQMIGVEAPRWHVLKTVIHQAIEDADLKGIAVTDLTGGVSVYADTSFEKAFANLFENTLRHSGNATEIRISISRTEPSILLVVEDNGTGIPVNDKTKIFGRGYGKGTGWGLFLVTEILAFTGMTITETGEPQKGTRFEIRIPPDHVRMEGRNSQASTHQ